MIKKINLINLPLEKIINGSLLEIKKIFIIFKNKIFTIISNLKNIIASYPKIHCKVSLFSFVLSISDTWMDSLTDIRMDNPKKETKGNQL